MTHARPCPARVPPVSRPRPADVPETDHRAWHVHSYARVRMLTWSRLRPLHRPPLQMTFDRPFLMLVLHVPTAVPLFVGRFNQPQLI